MPDGRNRQTILLPTEQERVMDDLNPASGAVPPLQISCQTETGKSGPADFYALRLILCRGGRAIELTRSDMVLGRHSEADIRLPLPDVSRRHCRFAFTAGEWQVFDLQSLNGLFVNEELVKQATLHHEDLIRIGSYLFEVDLHGDMESLPLPVHGHGVAGTIDSEDPEALPEAEFLPNPHRQAS